MPIDLGSVELYMGPDDLGAPDDLEAAIVGFVDGARKTLDVAVQELESEPIARALIAARKRGVRLRMVVESDYLIATRSHADPFASVGSREPNRLLYCALLRARIDVRTDYNPHIFHQKFMVRDLEESSRAVLTGSANFTPTGVHSNLNHVIVLRSKRIAEHYATEFDEIWGGTFGEKRERHERAPDEVTLSRIRVKPIFAPDHSPEMEIMKQMLKSKERIDFAIYTFARSSGIDDTMIALAKAGIRIRGIFDDLQGGQPWSATPDVKAAGAELFFATRPSELNLLHHKLMVIDAEIVIGGSFNYTNPANTLNDENIVVLGDLEETKADARANQRKVAGFALAEIDRMIADHGTPA